MDSYIFALVFDIWGIVVNNLPVLKNEIENLLPD